MKRVKYERNLGYNRNLMGGKRPNKKICRYGKYKTLSERLIAEADGLIKYSKRVGQYIDPFPEDKYHWPIV